MPEENLERIRKAIEQQLGFFTIIPIAADVIEESKSLIRRYGKEYGLRTLDARLSCFILTIIYYLLPTKKNHIDKIVNLQ